MYWSVIHGIKRKHHLSVVWNWYHFVAIANLHQPRPTDSADINTRLQLSDTSSIPPMHGCFLLWLRKIALPTGCISTRFRDLIDIPHPHPLIYPNCVGMSNDSQIIVLESHTILQQSVYHLLTAFAYCKYDYHNQSRMSYISIISDYWFRSSHI